MVMAIPIAFAAAGGALGWAVGATTFGISVGWMVGSWIAGPLAGSKNQIFDPGAQELFRTNQSLRGVTIPIIFGTNKVSSQIVWQNNFHYVKSKSGSGGGKGGGSGGGGGKGGQPESISYEYFIDVIYHLGMPLVPLNLFRIWLGAQEAQSKIVNQLNADYMNYLSSSDVRTRTFLNDGSWDFSNEYTNKTSGTNATNTNSTNPEITYTEAVWFPGNHPETGSWPYLNGVITTPISWPGTAWVGFKALSMGGQPSLPQLYFEVGPQKTVFTEEILNGWATGDLAQKRRILSPGRTDEHGNIWVIHTPMGDVDVHDQNASATIHCYNGTTGALLQSYTISTLVQDYTTVYSSFGWTPAATSFDLYSNAFISYDGTRILVHGYIVKGFPSGYVAFTIGSYTIAADGTLTLAGAVSTSCNSGTHNHNPPGTEICGQLGYGLNSDKIFLSSRLSEADPSVYQIMVLPSIDQIEHDDYRGLRVNRYVYNSDAKFDDIFLPFTKYCGISLPKLSESTGLIEAYRFYVYYNKSATLSSANTWINSDLELTYPNGALIHFEITDTTWIFTPGSTSTTTASLADAIINANIFTNSEGTTYTYHPDDQTDYTLETAQTLNNYSPAMAVFFENDGDESIRVVFHMPYETDSAWINGERPIRFRMRGFLYNAATGAFGFDYAETVNAGDLIDTYGGTNSTSITVVHSAIISDGGNLKAVLTSTTGGVLPSRVLKVDVATISYGEPADMTPPAIIKSILTHNIHGLYPGQTIIDETSWDIAHNYCKANGILCATQYRREEGAQNIIELLLALYDGWLTIDSSTNLIKFGIMDLANSPVRTIDNNHLVIASEGELPVKASVTAAQDTYNLIRVNYFDRNLDYEQNQIEEGDEVNQDETGVRLREFPPVFVMNERIARRLANRALWQNLYPRGRYEFNLGWKDSDLEPGDMVTLVDSFSGLNVVCQINNWEEIERGIFKVGASQQLHHVPGYTASQITSAMWDFVNNWDVASSYTGQSSAYSWNRQGGGDGTYYAQAFELPAEFSRGNPQVFFGWIPKGEAHSARLHISPDGETYSGYDTIDPYPNGGKILTPLPLDTLVPMVENVDVILHPAANWTTNSPRYEFTATFDAVTQDAMHNQAGLLWCGSEMLAFAGVTLTSQNRYTLSRVYRGWGGTPIGNHSSGDYFVEFGAGIFNYEYSEEDIGTTFYYKITPRGFNFREYSVNSAVGQPYTIKGTGWQPRYGISIQVNSNRGDRVFSVGSQGDITLSWKDAAQRSGWGAGGSGKNAGGYGGFVSDVASVGYWISVTGSGGLVVRSSYTNSSAFNYTNSFNAADNGAWRGTLVFRVTPDNVYGTSAVTQVVSVGVFE